MNKFFKEHVHPEKLQEFADNTVSTMCQLLVHLFIPIEGADVYGSHITAA